MTDEPALLAAIAARPDDDTPRLVYADWLDDHGAAGRAEFIRLQCALARGGPDDPAAAERADELENAHRVRWLTGVPTGPGLRWEFRRGFPERLEAEARTLLDRYDRVTAVPWLRDLCLTQFDFYAARDFVARPWSRGMVELEIWPDPVLDEARLEEALWGLIYCPQAAGLRNLRLGGDFLPPFTVSNLARSPHLSGLRLLGVPGDADQRRYAPLRARFGDRLVGEGRDGSRRLG